MPLFSILYRNWPAHLIRTNDGIQPFQFGSGLLAPAFGTNKDIQMPTPLKPDESSTDALRLVQIGSLLSGIFKL